MKNREEMLVRIIHALSEKFRSHLVLKGGMLLRLLNCPRSTQDVDYVWLSTESKKVLGKAIEEVLKAMPEITITTVTLNSRGIFIDVAATDAPEMLAKIEIDVKPSLNLPSEGISTVALANLYALTGRIVSTVALPEAFANKIAATLERDVARDLYDLCQFEPLCPYDLPTLQKRLAKIEINRAKPKAISFAEAALLMKQKMEGITESALSQTLYPLLPENQRQGLVPIIRAAVARVVQRLESQGG